MERELRDILVALDVSVKSHELKAKGVAEEMNMAPSTLYGELSSYANGLVHDPETGKYKKAKMGYLTALRLMKLTGDFASFHLAAAFLGLQVSPLGCDPVSEETAYPALSNAMSTLGELATALQQDMLDNALTKKEKLELFSKAVAAHDSLGPFLALGTSSQNRTK